MSARARFFDESSVLLSTRLARLVDFAVVPIFRCSGRKTKADLMQWLKRNKQKKKKKKKKKKQI
jgi:sirohydrochlorin ferrochelatase